MRALVKTHRGPGGLELLDRPEPITKPGWVTLKVIAAGICGTDIHIVHDRHPYWPPVTLGHEFVGRIVELGDGVDGWKVGDRVVSEPHALACQTCHLCRRGFIQLCAQKRSPGWGIDGALAEYVTVPAHLLHVVPESVTDAAAALCEPTAIAVSAIERVLIEPGDHVAVIGPGPVGVISAMVAIGAHARVVLIGRESSRARLKLAADLGIATWDHDGGELADAALQETQGRGFDTVIDTSGNATAIAAGIRMLRRRGRFCALGVSGEKVIPFPYDDALFRALDVVMSFSSSYTSWDRALALLSDGVVAAEALATKFPLANWADAFDAVERRQVMKAQIIP